MDRRQLEMFTEYGNIPWAGTSPRVLTKSYAMFSLDARARAGRSETPIAITREDPLQRVFSFFKEVEDGWSTP